MYFCKPALVLGLAAIAGFSFVRADVTPIFSDSFDSYADGNADTAFTSAYTAGASYLVSSSTGLGGSKSLQNTADATLIRKDSAINFTSGGDNAFVTVGIYFQYAGAGGLAGPQVGLVGASNGTFTTTADISGRLNGNKLQLRSNNGTVDTAATAASLITGNWYKLEYSVERTATTDTFNVSLSLYNASSAGVRGGLLDSIDATFANANMWGDSSVFAGIRENTSILNLDDFAALQGLPSTVPEPSSVSLLTGAASLGFIFSRRRRSSI
jgi:hypothetical protein